MARGEGQEGHGRRSSQGAKRGQTSHISASQLFEEPMAIADKSMQENNSNMLRILQAAIEIEEGNEQVSGNYDLKTMIENRVQEALRKRQQAEPEEKLLEVGSKAAPAATLASSINIVRHSPDLDLDDVLDHHIDETSTNDIEHDIGENVSEQGGRHEDPVEDQDHQSAQKATMHPMTSQERTWWAMSFEELYQHARSKNFGKTGKEGRKSGRVRIIKWLCENEGIIPYGVPSAIPVSEATPMIARPSLRPTGAISHPEAMLCTSDPILQRLINEAEKNYRQWPAADLLALAMQRSYQLLKDSKGKLPSKSISVMANWLAAWDVLKSDREKKWWLGDGIELVNRAKAMGYSGSSKKYDVILWLRSIPEEAEVDPTEVAEPTPNKKSSVKRKAEEAASPVSNRPAKGSKRPHGWHVLKSS